MSATRIAAGLGLGALLLAGCQSAAPQAPGAAFNPLTPGTVEYQLRQQQIQNAVQDPSRAMQNPVATGVGVQGIIRDPGTTGAGGAGAGAPVAVNPGTTGIVRQPGVGAPTR
jgi:hypothetical protein